MKNQSCEVSFSTRFDPPRTRRWYDMMIGQVRHKPLRQSVSQSVSVLTLEVSVITLRYVYIHDHLCLLNAYLCGTYNKQLLGDIRRVDAIRVAVAC